MAGGPSSDARVADVIIIGGGIIGCTIAFRLAQAGLKVKVFDRGEPGQEASAAAAGMLAPQGETVEPDAFFDFCAAGRDLYPHFVREVEDASGQRVGYRTEGSLLVAVDDDQCRELERTYQGQSLAGLKLERLAAKEAHALVPGLAPEVPGGVLIPGDHWVDNERLTPAVAEAARRLGVAFHALCPVTRLNLRGGRLESLETASDAAGETATFSAAKFVLAAGCWSRDLLAPLGVVLPMEPCRGQMMEFEAPSDLPLVVRAGEFYLVPRAHRRVLAGTTVEYVGYEKAVTGEGLHAILAGVTRFAPLVGGLRFRRAWAGLRPDTRDHRPILGGAEIDNLLLATGHFRNGILLAPITADVIAELVLKGASARPIGAYRPSRFADA